MEVVDELMTPGCPQCAIKHLSAAIYYRAQHHRVEGAPHVAVYHRTRAAVALINLAEALTGYKSHLWFAVGALVDGEVFALIACESHYAARMREARIELEQKGEAAIAKVMGHLFQFCQITDADWESAHYGEAQRELPAWDAWSGDYDLVIRKIREEYFITDEAPGASAEAAEKGGESDMATKKAAKADPKAAKAAAKGGKAKQACGKGGCAKKGKK
jgi:hypothetical protein